LTSVTINRSDLVSKYSIEPHKESTIHEIMKKGPWEPPLHQQVIDEEASIEMVVKNPNPFYLA
jgi:hypothetical protein